MPELTKLLPQDEQIDIHDFLSKVDDLAKKEKNAIRKKKILKAAAIIAAIAVSAVAIYYVGPIIVAHLASALPAHGASTILTQTVASTQTARMLGNSGLLSPSFEGTQAENDTIRVLKNMNSRAADRIIKDIENHMGSYTPAQLDQIINEADQTVKFEIKEKEMEIAKKAAEAAKKMKK